jgi:aflatoxin B1 aldehyde reductase
LQQLISIGPDESSGARITEFDEFTKHLDYFQSQGYDEVDTARMYVGGKQEGWTRQAGWKDRGCTIATKVYPYEAGVHKPENLKKHFNTSMEELGADCVDIFYLHAPDHSVPFEETLGAVNELHQAGKFVNLGLSNFAAWEVAEVYNICKERGWVKPTIYQAMYNAISKFTFCAATNV